MKKITLQFNTLDVENKGYSEAGASYVRRALKEMYPNSGSAASDINDNNYTLRQRSRMLYMGAPIATSAIKTSRTNVIGKGLRLKSTVNREVLGMSKEAADAWQKQTELEFSLWASKKNACDATGLNDFYEMQQLCLMSWLLSGDVFALIKRYNTTKMLPYGLRIHIVEADRVRTPNDASVNFISGRTTGKTKDRNPIYDGVEVDANGMIKAYHVANTYPYELSESLKTEFVRVEAYGNKTGLPNILHIMESERPDQYRGVPYLAQVIEPLLQIRRYTGAEITAAIVQSFFAAFITTNSQDPDMAPVNEAVGDGQYEISRDPNDYEMGPGTIGFLGDGEDIKLLASSHPNNNFDAFMKNMSEQVGSALEIPSDLLMKSFNASYSASRAALLEAWKAFKMRRTWMINDFCQPIYEIWMTEAVARGRISAPGFLTDPIIRQAYLQSEWIGPSQGQLDPTKELQAAVQAIDNGLSTREQEAIRLNGSEFSANVDKLTLENELLKAANGGNMAENQPKNIENEGENEGETEEIDGESEEETAENGQ